jgi:predicted anti-sigma-YlaC factor YlaD
MDCHAYREAISARIDGETHDLEARALDSHLATCAGCAAWADAAIAVTRVARMSTAEAVPDLAGAIVARAGGGPSRASRPTRTWEASPGAVARLGLVLVAVAQLFLAVPALLGHDLGASIHVAHEQGSWFLALGVGLLVAALQPRRAAALLPVVGALAAGFAFTMAVDIGAGRTQAAAEAPHGLAFLGLGFLWLLACEVRDLEVRQAPRRRTTRVTQPA